MAEPQKNTCIKLVAAFVWETQVPSLGWEDPLEKEMATHTSILAWSVVGYSSWGLKESDTTRQLPFPFPW